MSVFVTFSVGAAGSGGSRALYDTKQRATQGEHERLFTQNVPEYVDKQGPEITYKERRANLVEFVRQREEDELERGHDGSGETRTFYREIISFHEETTDEHAREMIEEFHREAYPQAVIITALHRNAEHLHAHSIILARQTDDKKLQLDWKDYHALDEKWAQIYGREFGATFELEHLRKKEERRAHRATARQARLEGKEPPPRPPRVSHARNQVEEKIKTSQREYAIEHAIEVGTGRGKRRTAAQDRSSADRPLAERSESRTRGSNAASFDRSAGPGRPGSRERDRDYPGALSAATRGDGQREQPDDHKAQIRSLDGEHGEREFISPGAAAGHELGQSRGEGGGSREQIAGDRESASRLTEGFTGREDTERVRGGVGATLVPRDPALAFVEAAHLADLNLPDRAGLSGEGVSRLLQSVDASVQSSRLLTYEREEKQPARSINSPGTSIGELQPERDLPGRDAPEVTRAEPIEHEFVMER